MMLSNSRTTDYQTIKDKMDFQTVRQWMFSEFCAVCEFVQNEQRREEKEECEQNREGIRRGLQMSRVGGSAEETAAVSLETSFCM